MRSLAYLAFFLSGASSLIFQAIWTRLLHHTFGATSVAMSSVLTAFMAGLGLGAHLFGRWAARLKRPLLVYAWCELGVAACALVIPNLVRSDGFLADINAWLRVTLGADSATFMLARFACVFPILIVPTTLMGGSLPLLAQHFVRDGAQRNESARVGALYAVNTLGAVAGTGLSSFAFMPAFGVLATNGIAVGINAGLGLAIVTFFLRPSSRAPAAPIADVAAEGTPALAASPFRRRLALWGFGISGACAMTYEVVWSRALSMAIGSSMQAFALILITFLIGIALGSAVVSRLLHTRELTDAGLYTLGVSACVLTVLSLAPALALSSPGLAALAGLLCIVAIVGFVALASRRARTMQELEPELSSEASRLRSQAAARSLALPCAISVFELLRFSLIRSSLPAVSVHGYLPHVTASVVLCVASFLWLLLRLRTSTWLLAGAVQLSIAVSTLASYVFQDEIPYGFARLVGSLGNPADHVSTVRFFMLLAAGLCTLPATLGMGAMFPVTLALWRDDDKDLGRDVGTVYAANTVGSILGSWLPGFVLMPRLGMEATLRVGILLNALVALAMLATRERAQRQAHKLGRALLATSGAMVLGLAALLATPKSPLDWDLSHMTLGAFRVSLARDVLDPTSWGQPDLVYYRDGVSTTVSVERWGRHLSLKNNGKVDASNGDDMPTQIMVAAIPLLLHARGARDLDVAIVGFGSGVTVGAALQFPVRHVEAMELEQAVVEAGVDFFADVSHLPRKKATFPYVDHPRLTLHNDDGRNFLAATPKRYDVIVSEPSNPWITGVSDLFTVDHFRVSKRKLKPDGVYCQWVQLYEMSPENIKTIYRTFASQFRYVMAFAAEELSSDTILVGSDAPLPLDVAHVARAMEDPSVATELARAYVHSPFDVWSRVLFANREEIMAFTHRELRREQGGFREVLRATGAGECAPPDCKREPLSLNTDDNMLIELRAPSDLIGFSRYEGYLSLFYGHDWPYAQLWPKLRGLDEDADKAAMALSLLAHGRKRDAGKYLSEIAQPQSDRSLLRDVITARRLLGDLPAPVPDIEPPQPTPPMEEAVRDAFHRDCASISQALQRDDAQAALEVFRRMPPLLRTLSGPGLRFLYGLVLMRAASGDRAMLKQAVAELEDLIRKDATYTEAHPELYYFLAMAQDAASSYDKAVRNMRAYVERTLEQEAEAKLAAEGDAAQAQPSARALP